MTKSTSTAPGKGSQQATSGPKPGTKLATLIELLSQRNGVTIDELVKATKWQAHSVRGAMSGTLKKRFGYSISSSIDEKRGRVYRASGQAGR